MVLGRESPDFDILDIERCSKQRVAGVLEHIKRRVTFMILIGEDYHGFIRDCLGTGEHNGWKCFKEFPESFEMILFKINDEKKS